MHFLHFHFVQWTSVDTMEMIVTRPFSHFVHWTALRVCRYNPSTVSFLLERVASLPLQSLHCFLPAGESCESAATIPPLFPSCWRELRACHYNPSTVSFLLERVASLPLQSLHCFLPAGESCESAATIPPLFPSCWRELRVCR